MTQKYVHAWAGLADDVVERITGHSFRAGGATDYLLAGAPSIWVQQQGRRKSNAYMLYLRLSTAGLGAMSGKLFRSLMTHIHESGT